MFQFDTNLSVMINRVMINLLFGWTSRQFKRPYVTGCQIVQIVHLDS